jgi:hypothetical protein
MARIILLFVVACITAFYFAVKYLPWWGVAGGVVVGLVLMKVVGGYLLKKLFLMPFKAKGAVLKGAKVTVHSVAMVAPPPPSGEEEDDEEDMKRYTNHYLIDATIVPGENKGPFHCWNPEEIELIQYGKAVNPDADEADRKDGTVTDVEVFAENAYHKFDGDKFTDSNRFRFRVRAHPKLKRASFSYYFTTFGDIQLPGASAPAAAPVQPRVAAGVR